MQNWVNFRAEEFKKQLTCFGENTEKYVTCPIEKEVVKIDKMKKRLQKICPTYYNLLTAQDFWQDLIRTLIN